MIPIYEQAKGKGIGLDRESFKRRFGDLCQEHLQSSRAKAFAFIFYDFNDQEFRRILKSQGVFVQLDRLAGTELSIFYLHSGGRKAVERFNTAFITRLGIDGNISLPCVIFFRLKRGNVEDLKIAELRSADLIHGFHELYEVVESYIKRELAISPADSKYRRWLKGGAKFIGIEAFKELLDKGLSHLL